MQDEKVFSAGEPRAPGREVGTGVARFLAACNLERADATPIWFMRQAGRSSAGYQQIRKDLDVLTLIKTPELCTQMTLLPVESFGVDAAVLYADILVPLEQMGMELELHKEGPVIQNPVRSGRDVDALRIINTEESAPYLFEAMRMVRRELEGKQAVIGVAGAPFTLACYLIEGKASRDYATARALMYGQPGVWAHLMEKLTLVTIDFVQAQVRAGANVVQVFDSWSGALSPSVYRRFVLPYMQRIFQAIKEAGVPAIHSGVGTAALLEIMVEAGGDVISVDWRVELDVAWKRIGYGRGIQGNLDPALLQTSWSTLEAGMQDVLKRADKRPGHIFNLGHGIPQGANHDLLRHLVDAVHATTSM